MTACPVRVAYTDVVDTDPTPGIAMLEAAGIEVVVVDSADPDVIARSAQGAVALLIGYSHIGGELLDALPSVRLVATQSAGVDMVDLDACRQRGVWVSNVPGAATEEVASHALAMTLSLARGLSTLDQCVRRGDWGDHDYPLRRLSELTIGVVGLGKIGRRYASMVDPLVGRVLGHDPFVDSDDTMEIVALDELFTRADVVTLHLPLTPDTRHLVDARRLGLMRKGSLLVNVSRGGIVDEGALADALSSGHIAAAGLDVLAEEPPPAGHPLVGHDRCLITPHAAFMSAASVRDYVTIQADNVLSLLASGSVRDQVLAGTR